MTHPLETKDPINSPNLPWLKIDQIAYAARTEQDVTAIKNALRLSNADWVEDEVVAEGYVTGAGDAHNVARLLFNYDLGIEIEILQYLSGANYLDALGIPSRTIAHIGAHLKPGAPTARLVHLPVNAETVQKVLTIAHTNPSVNAAKRRYTYTIFDTRAMLGSCFKVIERREIGDDDHW